MARSFTEIGGLLRAEREKRGLRIAEIAKTLKIRAAYIEAIEEGRFGELPGAAYTFGYLKVYSNHLSLESPENLNSFKELMDSELFTSGLTPQGDPYSHELKPNPGIVFIALLLMVLVYFFWYYAIYFPGRINARHQAVIREKALIEKAKDLYGTGEENQ